MDEAGTYLRSAPLSWVGSQPYPYPKNVRENLFTVLRFYLQIKHFAKFHKTFYANLLYRHVIKVKLGQKSFMRFHKTLDL